MQNISTKVNNNPNSSDGVLTAEEFNNFMNDVKNFVITSGQTLQINDLYQLSKAAGAYAVVGQFFLDSGVVNTYTLTIPGTRRAPASYLDGMRIRFFAANTNSGSSTVNIAGLGSKNIKLPSGADLPASSILAGSDVELTYRESLDYFILSQNVRVTSDQTVFDKKTFNTVPASNQDPVSGNDLVRKSYVDTAVSSLSAVPIGTIINWGGSVAPSGYAFLIGQAISRTTYSTLFSNYGTTFGSGDGSTTFNVPDYRGRTSFGRDNMGGVAANRITVSGSVLGSVGGTEFHTLTISEMPSHNHSEISYTYAGGPVQNGSGNGRVSGVTGDTGGGLPHNNMPPYIVMNKIIRLL